MNGRRSLSPVRDRGISSARIKTKQESSPSASMRHSVIIPSSPASARIHAVEDILLNLENDGGTRTGAGAVSTSADTTALVGAVRGLLRRVAALESSRAALLERVASLQSSAGVANLEAGFAAEALLHAEANVVAANARASKAEALIITLSSTVTADAVVAHRTAANFSSQTDELTRELERREAARLEANTRAETNRAVANSHARACEAATLLASRAGDRAIAAETSLAEAYAEANSKLVMQSRSAAATTLLDALLAGVEPLRGGEGGGGKLHPSPSASGASEKKPAVGVAVVVLTDVAAATVANILRRLAISNTSDASALSAAASDHSAEPSLRLSSSRCATLRVEAAAEARRALTLVTGGPEAVVVETSAMTEALAISRGARLPLTSAAARRLSRAGGWAH